MIQPHNLTCRCFYVTETHSGYCWQRKYSVYMYQEGRYYLCFPVDERVAEAPLIGSCPV